MEMNIQIVFDAIRGKNSFYPISGVLIAHRIWQTHRL